MERGEKIIEVILTFWLTKRWLESLSLVAREYILLLFIVFFTFINLIKIFCPVFFTFSDFLSLLSIVKIEVLNFQFKTP